MNVELFLSSLIGAIIPAIVAYWVSKMNIKSEKENINKQILAESRRLEIQYELAQKRDNTNYLNRFKIEKLAELNELVTIFLRYDTKLTNLNEETIRRNLKENGVIFTQERIDSFKAKRNEIEQIFYDEGIMKRITMMVIYFPPIKNKWESVINYHLKYVCFFPDQIMGDLEVKKEVYERYKIPERYTVQEYLNDLEYSTVKSLELIDVITDETEKIMKELSI